MKTAFAIVMILLFSLSSCDFVRIKTDSSSDKKDLDPFLAINIIESDKDVVDVTEKRSISHVYSENSIYEVAAYGTAEEMRELLARGESPNKVSSEGFSPLFYAVLGGKPKVYADCFTRAKKSLIADNDDELYKNLDEIAPYYYEGNLNTIKELIKAGGNVKIRDRQQLTVFDYACMFSSSRDVLAVLADAGADLNAMIDIQYPNSLLAIASFINPNAEVVKYVAEKSGNISQANNYGTTAIQWAAMYSRVIRKRFCQVKHLKI